MWPMLLDLSRDECKRILRKLELEAYASIVTAFRAQGSLTKEKKKLLQDLSSMLSISLERHRAEIRRAVNDEHLNTIADRISGPNTSADWSIEGRRLIPLMPRLVPQTAFTAMANAVASIQAAKNASMPLPSASGVKEGTIPTTSSAPPTPSRTPTPTQACKISTSANGVKTSPINGSSPVAITSGVAMKVVQQEPEEDIDDESSGGKRKRSASLDSVPPVPEKIITTSQPISSVDNQITEKIVKNINNIPFPASTSLLSQISPTVRATYGATPIRIALPPTQKQATAINSSPTPKQVVLVPASSTSTSTSIFQRSATIPIVKTVSTTAATITQKQSKMITCSQNPSVQGALLVTGKLATSPSVITATVGQTNTVGTIARPLTKTLPIPRQIMRPRSSVLPLTYQNKVQLVGQNFSAQLPTPTVRQSLHLGTPIQVKQVSAVGRTAVQIRHEGGVKIVAQGLPVATSKILPKPTASPIVMVSSTQSGGTIARFTTPSVVSQNTFGTKMVSLSGSQAQVTSKVTTIGNVSLVSRTGHGFTARASPTIIQPPGVKPNVIVVHKAQVWPQSQGQGTTIVVSGGSVPKLSAEAVQEAVTYIQKQERNRINTPATIISVPLANAVITSTAAVTKTTTATTTYPSSTPEKHTLSCGSTGNASDNKRQASQDKDKEESSRKNNLLADLIEATGIFSDSSESSSLTGSVKASMGEVKKTANIEETVTTKLQSVKETEEQEVRNETWTTESRSQETVPLETSDQKESTEEQQLINMDPSMNIQDLNLPLEQLDEEQILEIQTQDEESLLSQSTRLTKEMLEELLQQAGLHIQGVEVKSELQNEGNQTPVATAASVLNISKPTTSSLPVDEVACQSKNDDLKLAKESTVDSCMKLVLCEQNSPFESANIEKTIQEIALKGDEVFENAELQRKCIEEEESQSDEQATVIELLSSEFNVSQLEDDQFMEAELDIPELTKNSPRKEDEDTCIAQSSTVSFPSKRYLSGENVKVDYITAMPEDELKGIFQNKSLEMMQIEVKDICSTEAAYSNVRVEPSGLDTSTMNLEDFTSQRVEGNATDHCSLDVSQELESTTDGDNVEENLYPIEEIICESSIENTCKPEEENACKLTKENKCKPTKENTFNPSEENIVKPVEENIFKPPTEENTSTLAEENTCKLARDNTCKLMEENTSKLVEGVCKPAEENISKPTKIAVCETIKKDTCKLNQGNIYEPIKEATYEPAVENNCKQDQEGTYKMIQQTVKKEILKSAEINTALSDEENACKLSEGTSCIPIKENICKPSEDNTCSALEELTIVTAEEPSKQSECPSESSEEPLVEGSNIDIPVRRKRKYPIELQELPHLTGWARMASGLLEKVCKFRGPGRLVGAAHWFLQPVISAEAPGYYDVVKQPMDFSTIKKKLENGRYQNLMEFHADMMLVRSNCELYNPPGHEARTDCEEVFSFYLQEYNRIVEKWQKSHLLSSSRRTKAAKE